ncbi:Protein kinase domain-containing protein [Mycena sanguinolenta]|uniref:Protein kinase domain-containing protein n=1 Tax=Mycena sanguinolenta TaxID=230812 RepID=A0A8H6XDU7_9AGAR|nr:Protein kinase domain-containing protein [Mycena sanguinolenta]
MPTTHTSSSLRSTSESAAYYPTYRSNGTASSSRQRSTSEAVENAPPSRPTFKYVLGEMIGKGSYAKVYLALNSNGELMAVKRVETPQTASDLADSRQLEMVEALKFESKTLKDLEHPNIVQYLGFEETLHTLNIFLEYVPGGTIRSCLQKHGKFDQDVTKWFTSQILAGLEYLHSTGILHRDLKGDNILVQTSGVCKISDFGISKKEDMQGQAFTGMKGTTFWMAPEVLDANNKRGYDSKVDIWSVGCVVLEMWTGERPWAGEELIPVMLKLYNKRSPPVPPSILSGLSELALDFRAECFAMDPRQRPTAAVLQNHPYLQRTPSWVFQLSDIERSTPRLSISRSKRLSSRNSSAPASRHRRSATEPVDAPPVPTISGDSTFRSNYLRPPSLDTDTLRPRPHTPRPARPPSNEPPPIVFIAPLSSPARGSPRSSTSPGTSESTRTSGSLRTRKSGFFVANPDPEPGDKTSGPSFVFNPPPLPTSEAPPRRPSTAQHPPPKTLKPRLSVADLRAEERRLAPAISMQQLAGRVGASSSRQTSSSRISYYSDSDSDSISGSMWKKPPVELQKARAPSPSPSKATRYTHRRSIIETKRESTWAPRPRVREVYSHLQEFFPRVDLDKPMVTTTMSDRQQRTKSIRMTVEELNRANSERGLRRAGTTKLWGHKVEEVTIEGQRNGQ